MDVFSLKNSCMLEAHANFLWKSADVDIFIVFRMQMANSLLKV
jgi:hypothetical protein